MSKSLLTCSQTRTAGLGSRLKRLRDAARIICALLAHKFHTCRARRVLSEVHAPGQNELTFYSRLRARTPRGFWQSETRCGAKRLRTAFCLKYLKNDICGIAGFNMGKGGAPSVRPAQAMRSLQRPYLEKRHVLHTDRPDISGMIRHISGMIRKDRKNIPSAKSQQRMAGGILFLIWHGRD